MIEVPLDLLNDIVGYLSRRPFAEVASLFERLSVLETKEDPVQDKPPVG